MEGAASKIEELLFSGMAEEAKSYMLENVNGNGVRRDNCRVEDD